MQGVLVEQALLAPEAPEVLLRLGLIALPMAVAVGKVLQVTPVLQALCVPGLAGLHLLQEPKELNILQIVVVSTLGHGFPLILLMGRTVQ